MLVFVLSAPLAGTAQTGKQNDLAAQANPQASELPSITRINPDAAAPQTRVEIEGFRLGANLTEGVRVLFVQGTAEYEGTHDGGEYKEADLKQGPQKLDVIVPEQLQTGPCQVIVEVRSNRSTAVTIQIKPPATAPVLSDSDPCRLRAGEIVWIKGAGFSDSDDIVLTDAGGEPHHFEARGHASGTTLSLTLPEDLPVGEARLQAIERRSGANLSSNNLTLTIVQGPIPFDLSAYGLMPVAPGQWLDLATGNEEAFKSVTRVDVMFQANEQGIIVPAKSSTQPGLRVQVPLSLAPGKVKIQMRTIIGELASAWSDKVDYQLLDKPAAAKIYNLEIWPVKVEAAFKQGDKTVAIVPIAEADYPRVRVPANKLSPGLVTVETRVWRGGEPSAWLYKNDGFDWPSKLEPIGFTGEMPFIERIYLGPDTAKELTVYPGEKLTFGGTFPTASVEEVEFFLRSDGRAPVVLHPIGMGNPYEARITLPDDLAEGDWAIEVINQDNRASVTLPFKLRVPKVSPVRKTK